MTDDERVGYLAAIIAKASDPLTAARAIVEGGFCVTVDLEEALLELLRDANARGPRDHKGQRKIQRVYLSVDPHAGVRCAVGRWQGRATEVAEAITACQVAMDEWIEARLAISAESY